MKWKPTWLLLGLAALLFAFIFLIERHWKSTSDSGAPPERLLGLRAAEVTNVQLLLTNQLVLRAERARTDAPWNLLLPLNYPAQAYPIELLLQALEILVPATSIPQSEISAHKRTIAQYGLDVPQATLTLLHNGQRTALLFGSKTAVGDQVYLQVQNQPGVHVVTSDVFDHLPRSHNDWRDTALVDLANVGFSRLEVRGAGRNYALEFDPTNEVWFLSKPTVARADTAKVDALLRQVRDASVSKFISDHPRPDLDLYGLQPPVLELAFVKGTNDLVVVQFGKSPTNDPAAVFARRMSHTNIVLAPKSLLDVLQVTYSDLRNLRLVNLPASGSVDVIEVIGAESFVVRHQTNGTWIVGDTQPFAADPGLVRDWIEALAKIEGVIEKDVVTDLTAYGLNPPARQYVIKSAVTNATGSVSNRLVAELNLGLLQGEKVFARRPDEATVYSLTRADVARLPSAAWQLRDRRVWNFTTNQVSRVSIRRALPTNTVTKVLQRSSSGSWNLAAGSGAIDSRAFDQVVQDLGELRAAVWVARGEENREKYGFKENGDQITIELKNGDKPHTLTLEFGGRAPNNFPYTLAVVDAQTWIFELPVVTFVQLVRDLINPLFPPPTP